MSAVGALTIYAMRRDVDGQRVTDFDTVVVPDKLLDPGLEARDFTALDDSWAARLFLWPGSPRPPAWLGYVRKGFSDDLQLPDSAPSSAVVVIRVFHRRDRYYAVAFGGGRHAIRREAIDPKYGLQVALNAIYQGDENSDVLSPAARIRQVDTRTVSATTVRTQRQSNRSANFDVFDLDPDADQLDGITGSPIDELLGRRIRGTDSFRLGRSTTFDELGDICRNLARFHEKKDYQSRFSFVDNIQPETNAGAVADLKSAMIESFLSTPESWAMAPPALLDYDAIDVFEIPELELLDVEISPTDLAAALSAEGITAAAELAHFALRGLDARGDVVDSWSLIDCLDGQVTLDGTTYLVDGGEFYTIAAGYLAELNEYISGIPRSSIVLPDSVRAMKDGDLEEIVEGEYNELAADSSDQFMLLDKKLVKVSAKADPVEICDVLSLSGQLVHVKRKFSSSSLSHLFAQGFVSSELLADDPEYRAAIRAKIDDDHAEFRDLFPDTGLVTGNFEVVYAIVADWQGRELINLPFFSKVNLRRYRRALKRLQFEVTYADVPVVDP